MNENETTVSQALNQIQSWLNAGEYSKVIQGCQEILEVEPSNQRALALMKKAEEERHRNSTPSSPTPSPETPFEPPADPLAHLQVEPISSAFPHSDFPETHEKRKLFLAMLIPAILVVLLGGGLIWWMANEQREEIIEENLGNAEEPQNPDRSYLEENEERVEQMSKITTVLEAYKVVNGAYPSIEQVERVLAESESFNKVPKDPRQGEEDKAGKAFGYVYAVYGGIGGENSVYILSALFEDSKGFAYPWTKGAPIKNYPDYRDTSKDHIRFIE